MSNKLTNKKVAVLVTNGFEEVEFTKPLEALLSADAAVDIVSLKGGEIRSWHHGDWGKEYYADKSVEEVSAADYDALVLPGGVMNPDSLRMDEAAVKFVSGFIDDGKPVAAICHGPWMLVETGRLRDRTLTSYPSLRTDIINAGAHWMDKEVVVDKGLVTSRKPEDLNAFCEKMIEEIAAGRHPVRKAF